MDEDGAELVVVDVEAVSLVGRVVVVASMTNCGSSLMNMMEISGAHRSMYLTGSPDHRYVAHCPLDEV